MGKLTTFFFFFFVFFYLYQCLKLKDIKKRGIISLLEKDEKKRVAFIHKYFLPNINIKRNANKHFYKSKKEKEILESGYLYPFDHLEKKKKKFPPDPYVPNNDENEENEENIFGLNENENELLDYDNDDEDAKKNFGKTTFNYPHYRTHIKERTEEYSDQNCAEMNKDVDEHSCQNGTEINIADQITNAIIENEEMTKTNEIEKEIINVYIYSSEINKEKNEIIKDKLYYLMHTSMDSIFIKYFELNIQSQIDNKEKKVSVSYEIKNNTFKKNIHTLTELIEFSHKLKKIINDKVETLFKEQENEEETNINEYEQDKNEKYLKNIVKKELEEYKKERNISNISKRNLQVSIESSLKLIEKCTEKMYTQNYEITLRDLKLAYNMLPCKYYGYFLSDICANISMLSYYTNDLQGAFNFALKSIKYEPKYKLSWKCLGDAYRSFRKFWQAKNFYDIAIYLGYKDEKGENFEKITQELTNLTQSALKNVDLLKTNMNNYTNIIIKKNIGIVLNKNPDEIGGCYVSYIIEGSKASKKNFNHGDQIVALNNIVTYGKPIDDCLKAFQKNDGSYDIIFFKGNIIELYGLQAYKYLIENNLFYTLFENEKISSFKRNETILFDMKGFGTFSEYGMSKGENM
ncbi:uncharacterized protein PY17X_0408400 [Plasmodium yoelii]|uniref:PDZ domain-containing protein n=2 Tax=Plasmodium yoelii TaxID=5861 RepID=A0AAF0B097_PLAYO|nr:uncharacterized protein PY17X_0408400 [Plasmodium yoelii]WBY55288.1 PDZ domain-containing protein [Plasmodium yoelii yoelii]CDU16464.1 conserved Plasmodium protein, unknown function [Plasmodium yoelii]VTZ73268.1 conserved Plasmodium protein, unknown function [Plasmodium yoelii]|eukprot:XP_729775.2 uncharacterized protein PY17X_0408400 [Plasmodium yoelii]